MREKNARKIRAWMARNGVRQIEIARKMGVSGSMIYRFVNGKSASARVFEHFMDLGCPREYFSGRSETRGLDNARS